MAHIETIILLPTFRLYNYRDQQQLARMSYSEDKTTHTNRMQPIIRENVNGFVKFHLKRNSSLRQVSINLDHVEINFRNCELQFELIFVIKRFKRPITTHIQS